MSISSSRLSPSVLILLILTFLSLSLVSCWPTGATEAACNDQIPLHEAYQLPTYPQTHPNGYKLRVTNETGIEMITPVYTAPHPLTITFEAPASVPAFKGYMVSVFSARTGQRIGRMTKNMTDSDYVCTQRALTHTTPTSKRSFRFHWSPPESVGSGPVTVNITLVITQPTVYSFVFMIEEVEGPNPPDTMAAPMLLEASVPTIDGTNVIVGWTKPFNGRRPIHSYILSMRTTDPVQSSFSVVWEGLAYSTTVMNLQNGTTYEFVIQANNTWVSDVSPALTVVPVEVGATLPTAPAAPSVPATSPPTHTSISLTWPDSGAGSNVQFIGYVLQMKLATADDTAYKTIYQGVAPSYTVDGLTFFTSYTFRVQSRSMAGSSGYSSSFTVSSGDSDCSDVGAFTPSGTCFCIQGHLGLQCEQSSPFVGGSQPCFADGRFCFDFLIRDGLIYGRLQAQTNPNGEAIKGWLAIGFGATDGMTGGHMMIFTMPNQYEAKLYNMIGTGLKTPTLKSTEGLPKSNYSGFYNATHLDVSFVRSLDTGIGGEYVIDPTPGVFHRVSWAFASSFLQQHKSNDRGLLEIDFGTRTIRDLSSSDVSYNFYIPFLVACLLILLTGIILRFSSSAMHSSWGTFLLRQRPAALIARKKTVDSAAEATHAQAKEEDMTIHKMVRWLDTITFDIRPTLIEWTWGELLAFVAYGLGLIVSIVVGYSTYVNESASYRRPYIFGHLTSVQLALVFLPVVRNSIWLKLLGISYERAIRFHRIMARITLIFVVIHMISMEHIWTSSIYSSTESTRYGDGTAYGFIAFLGILAMVVFSFEPIRRHAFDTFLILHLIIFPTVVVFACLHNTQVRFYFIAPLSLYLIDRFFRFFQSTRRVEIVSLKVLTGDDSTNADSTLRRVIRLEVTLPPRCLRTFTYSPGDYCFLNVPSVDYFAWHPFSISSSPYSVFKESITFHIMDMGPGTFTNRLADFLIANFQQTDDVNTGMGKQHRIQPQKTVAQLNNKESIQFPISIDGPYGNLTVPLDDYSTIVLVAGGIGITPLYSILSSLLIKQHTHHCPVTVRTIHLIWTSRVPAAFTEYFPELISTLYPMFHETLKLHFFYTGRGDVVGSAPIADVLVEASRRNTALMVASRKSSAVTPSPKPTHATNQTFQPNSNSLHLLDSNPALAAGLTIDDGHRFGQPSRDELLTPSQPTHMSDGEELVPASSRTHADSDAPPPPPPPPSNPPSIPAPDPNPIDSRSSSSSSSSPPLDVSSSARPSKISIHTGRPNLALLFDQIDSIHLKESTNGASTSSSSPSPVRSPFPPTFQSSHIAIYTCGPKDLCDKAQHHAMVRGWHLHRERFTL